MRSSVLAAIALVALATAGGSETLPPPPARHFDDRAAFVPREAADRLDAKLREFEARTGNQLVVAIFPSLPSASLEDFTVRVAQAWRVGQKGLDNGAVLFVFVQERKLRIEVGYGLEARIPDARAKRILDEAIAPELKAGRPAAAMEAGVEALMAATEGREVATPPVAAAADVPMPPAEQEPPPSRADDVVAFLNAVARIRPFGFPVGFAALFLAVLTLLTLPLRASPIRRRMRKGEGFFPALMREMFVVLSWFGSSSGSSTSYSSSGRSSSGSSYSGGGGRFGGGGASGGW